MRSTPEAVMVRVDASTVFGGHPGEGDGDGAALVALCRVVSASGLDVHLRDALTPMARPRAGYHPGLVVRQLSLEIALGGRCRADLPRLRRHARPPVSPVASSTTVTRTLADLGQQVEAALVALRRARAAGRARVYALVAAGRSPGLPAAGDALTLDLVELPSRRRPDRAWRGRPGPVWAVLSHGAERTAEVLDCCWPAAEADAATAYEQALQLALDQLPATCAPPILVRVGAAGPTNGALTAVARRGLPLSVEIEATPEVVAAAAGLPPQAWRPITLDGDQGERTLEVAEVTGRIAGTGLPPDARVVVGRTTAGAPLTCFATTAAVGDPSLLLARHRGWQASRDLVATLFDAKMSALPASSPRTAVWSQLVALAADLLAWQRMLVGAAAPASALSGAGARRRTAGRGQTAGAGLVAAGAVLIAAAVGFAALGQRPAIAASPTVPGRLPAAAAVSLPSGFAPVDVTAPGAAPVSTLSPPVEVAIPAIGVRSALVGLRLNRDGSLQVPTSFAVAGWYSEGPVPGAHGRPAVIVGHVDSYRGPAVFYRLRDLRPGDSILVRRADGVTLRFDVYRSATYRKDGFPSAAVYAPTARPELRLITCAGIFDLSTRHYLSNEVVYAVEEATPMVPPKPSAAPPGRRP